MSLSKKLREYCLSKGWKEVGFNDDITSRTGRYIDLTVDMPDKEEKDNFFRLYIFIPRGNSDIVLNVDTGVKKSQLSLDVIQTISHVLPTSYTLHHDTTRYMLRTSVSSSGEQIQNLENVLTPMILVVRVLQKIISQMQDCGEELAEKYAKELEVTLAK